MRQFAVFALLLCTACDVLKDEPGNPCFPLPTGGRADYFPLSVGDTLSFHYAIASRMQDVSTRDEGVLTWTVRGIECSSSQARYSIEERWTGLSAYEDYYNPEWDTTQVSDSRVVTLTEDRQGQMMLPYGTEPFNRYYAPLADTIGAQAGWLQNTFVGYVRSCSSHRSEVWLKRGAGLVYYDGGCGTTHHTLFMTLERIAG